jgi:hypothetical protein
MPGVIELTAAAPHRAIQIPVGDVTLISFALRYQVRVGETGLRRQAHSLQVDGLGRHGIPGFLLLTPGGWLRFRANSAGAEKPWVTAVTAEGAPPGGPTWTVEQSWRAGQGTTLRVSGERGVGVLTLVLEHPTAPLRVRRAVEVDLGYPVPIKNPEEAPSIGWAYSSIEAEWEVAP